MATMTPGAVGPPERTPLRYPGQALVCELYLHARIRSVETGQVMFGKPDPATGQESVVPLDLVRLAIPRRVYTQSHVEYVLEAAGEIAANRSKIGGYEIVDQPAVLRHFTARFRPLGSSAPGSWRRVVTPCSGAPRVP